jgi:hypothetical protein
MSIAVYVALEPAVGRPVGLARVTDPELIRRTARAALTVARKRATDASAIDRGLGQLRLAEAEDLKDRLSMFLPDFVE